MSKSETPQIIELNNLRPFVLRAKQSGDWQGLVKILAPVLLEPDLDWPLPTLSTLALALMRLERISEASVVYETLRRRWPDHSAGWSGLAEIKTRSQEWPAAAQCWQDCLARFPDEELVGWRTSLIQALQNQGDLPAARTAAAGLRARWPDNVLAWRINAELSEKVGDFAAAAMDWQSCLDKFPSLQVPAWWASLAGMLRKLNRLDEAADVCMTLKESWPASPAGWRLAINLATDAKDWVRAAQAWEECIAQFPDQATVSWWIALAWAQRRVGRMDAAAQTLELAKARWPHEPEAWIAQAEFANRHGNWPKAARMLDDCRRRFDLDTNAVFLKKYCACLIRAGRMQEAESWVRALQTLDPDSADWLVLRLDLLRAQGDLRTALAELQNLSGHPVFAQAFSAQTLISLFHDVGLTEHAARSLLQSWLGTEDLSNEIAVCYYPPAPKREHLLSSERVRALPTRRVDSPGEFRRRLRMLARDRTCKCFDALVASALLSLDRPGLERLLRLAIRRFPASRARIKIEAMLTARTIPANDPDQAYAFGWQTTLPPPAKSLAYQLAGRPWRRLVCVVMVCDEDELLPIFFEHYQNLGVESFIVIDNGSQHHPSQVLGQINAEITFVNDPYLFRESHYGKAWLNEILELGICDWCLFADADEFLMYAGSEKVKLPQLLNHFDQRGETAMSALMVDVYDVDFLHGRGLSNNIANYVLFSASHNTNGGVKPLWQTESDGYVSAGILSRNPNKMPLVKASCGVRYVTGHFVTSCTPSETTAVFQHLKLFRDRELIALSPELVLQHPRVRDRGMGCVNRHIDMAEMNLEDAVDPAFCLPFSSTNLQQLGYCRSDSDWQSQLAQPIAADRRTPAAKLRHDPLIRATRELTNFPMMNEPLPKVLAALRCLADLENRVIFRKLLSAQLARIGPREIRLAMVLFSAVVWKRTAAAERLVGATRRAIEKSGTSTHAVALCDIANALNFVPKYALSLLNAIDQAIPDVPCVAQRLLYFSTVNGDREASFGILKRFAPDTDIFSVNDHMRLLRGVSDWAQFGDVLHTQLNLPTLTDPKRLLARINEFPYPDAQRHFRQHLLARLETQPLLGESGSTYLSLLHLLNMGDKLTEYYPRLKSGLPSTAKEYFRRLMAAKSGAPAQNRFWAVGLSKTGTSSLHTYCESIGLLSAHWINPVTHTLLDLEDAKIFDVVSDTSITRLARIAGVPAGRKIITTMRDFPSWSESFLEHYRRVLFLQKPVTFEKLRDVLRDGRLHRFGAVWHAIVDELYLRFRDLREIYDYQYEWTKSLATETSPHLYVHLEMKDEEKAAQLSAFLGRPDVTKPYPHSNKRKF